MSIKKTQDQLVTLALSQNQMFVLDYGLRENFFGPGDWLQLRTEHFPERVVNCVILDIQRGDVTVIKILSEFGITWIDERDYWVVVQHVPCNTPRFVHKSRTRAIIHGNYLTDKLKVVET